VVWSFDHIHSYSNYKLYILTPITSCPTIHHTFSDGMLYIILAAGVISEIISTSTPVFSYSQSPKLLKLESAAVQSISVDSYSSKAGDSSPPSEVSSSLEPTYKFNVKSPYRNPGPRRHGYSQQIYDGGKSSFLYTASAWPAT